jgi:hypothetical protein
LYVSEKKMAKRSAAGAKPKAKLFEEIVFEVPPELVKGMDLVGITDRSEYITFLIASSLLNYSKIWKHDKELEKELQKIKLKSDNQNYMR